MLRCALPLAAALIVASCTQDSATTTVDDGVPGNESLEVATMVGWLVPAVDELPVRSEAEKAHGMEHGRTLPEKEFLQPPLDPALPPFTSRLQPTTSAEYIGGASDILPELVHAWIDAFNEYYPNVSISLGSPYAGSLGMLEVIDGEYDFVFVSRELKPTDITQFKEKFGYEPFSIPISGASYRHYGFLDAIGFFVNVDNPIDRISLAQIDAIFSSTRHRGNTSISTWGELGLTGTWRDKPVTAYGVEPWNGFEEFVRQRILNAAGERGQWRDDVNFSHTAFPIAGNVANDRYGIGYTGLAYIDHGVKVLPLVDDAGEIFAASYENVAKATYPLSRLIYFNTNRPPADGADPVLDEFLRFVLSREGQQVVREQGIYLPLRAWQVEAALTALESK